MHRSKVIFAITLVLRIGLFALFVSAAWNKFADPRAFAADIANYQLLPALAPFLAAVLPATELVVGWALLMPSVPWRRAGALAIAFLMLVFTIAAVAALARGID